MGKKLTFRVGFKKKARKNICAALPQIYLVQLL